MVGKRCTAGRIHTKRFGKSYHFSWLATGKDTKWDWEGARNYCRKFCMDSISIETKNENDWVKNIIRNDDIHYIWTGGRKCKKSILNPYCSAKPNTQAWVSFTYKQNTITTSTSKGKTYFKC